MNEPRENRRYAKLSYNKRVFAKYPYVTGLFVGVFFAIFTMAIIDLIAFYVLDIKPSGYGQKRFIESHSRLGWFHVPGAEGYSYKYNDSSKWYVHINSHGFSDSERKMEKTRPRIALIGDSTTESWEVDEPDRPQYIIERLLDQRFEVLNMGVRGYGTDQTFLLFNSVGVCFDPDIVIYTFCINDIHDNVKTERKQYFRLDEDTAHGLTLEGYPIEARSPTDTGVFDKFTNYSLSYRMIAPNVTHMARQLLVKTGLVGRPDDSLESHFELRPYRKVYDDEDERRIQITKRIISMLNDLTESHGMKLLVVEGLYRHILDETRQRKVVQQYGDNFDFDKVSRVLHEHAREVGIAFLSLPRMVRDSQVRVADLMHPEDSMHLNKNGVLFYSNAVVEKLRSLGWLDGESSKDFGLPSKRIVE